MPGLPVGAALGAFLEDAGVGEGGPDGEVEVEAVAGGVDRLGRDVGVVDGWDISSVGAGSAGLAGMATPSGRVKVKVPPSGWRVMR